MLSVLVVCTGNICRSPAAQLVLGAALDDSVVVASAGTGAVVGAPVAPGMARLLADRGLDPSGFVARALTEDQVRSADLVLTMTRRHRTAVLELAPWALRRTFLFTELTSIAERLGAPPPGADDVGEPRPERARASTWSATRRTSRTPTGGRTTSTAGCSTASGPTRSGSSPPCEGDRSTSLPPAQGGGPAAVRVAGAP